MFLLWFGSRRYAARFLFGCDTKCAPLRTSYRFARSFLVYRSALSPPHLLASACPRFFRAGDGGRSGHSRFKLHFTPTSASWLNLVERFFAEITSRRIPRGSYTSVDDQEAAIHDYLAQHNETPKPFRWTKSADDILARERRALDALDEIRRNR